MKFEIYNDWHQIPDSANQLFAEYEKKSLFLSRTWFENITHYSLAKDQKLVITCVTDGQTVVAILPMKQCSQGSLSSLSTNFTSYYSLLVANGNRHEAIINCLAEGLSKMPVKLILFEPIDDTDSNMQMLQTSLHKHAMLSYPYFRFYNWVHQTNGQTFTQYMQGRPSNLINTIKRKQRKLEREHNYAIKLYKEKNIDQALIDYQTVYKNSWKANELQFNFTPKIIKHASELDWLRLGILYIDAQPIAAQIWFIVNKKASIYRLVYDENWKQYSPGSILTKYLMQNTIDTEKATEIDFLTGNERYKQDWMTLRRERIGIRFVKKEKPISWIRKLLNRIVT